MQNNVPQCYIVDLCFHFIVYFFRNIDDDIKNINELPIQTIIESASTCLSTINPSVKVSRKLPSGISHRIEVASQIASLCKVILVTICYLFMFIIILWYWKKPQFFLVLVQITFVVHYIKLVELEVNSK